MARAAATDSELLVLVYSARTLPKDDAASPALLDETDRLESVLAWCEARGLALGLCSHGLLADQVAAAAERFPGADLALAIGSDKLLQVLDPSWYDDRDRALDGLFERARLRYAVREGDEGIVAEALGRPDVARWLPSIERLEVPAEVATVSSRLVRDRLRAGEDVDGLVPEEIRPYLRIR